MAKTIDAAQFEKAFQDALPGEAKTAAAKAEDARAKGVAVQTFAGLDDLQDTFCGSWERIEGFLNMAIKGIGWFMPKEAAMAKAFIKTVRKTIIPVVCPVKGTGE